MASSSSLSSSAWPKIRTLASRELGFFFNSPIAWIVTTLFLVVSGALLFVFELPDGYGRDFFELGEANLRALFGPSAGSAVGGLPLLLAFLVPAVTMRLVSEEKRTGTLELLVTWPLSESQIVLGKYLGALGFLALMLLASLPLVVLVAFLGPLDWGLVLGGYLGLFLLGATYAALGLLSSTWTRNQIVAYLVGVTLCAFFYFVDGLLGLLGPELRQLFAALSVKAHFQDIARGVLDVRDVVFYLSLIGVALWASVLSLGVRRWEQAPRLQRRQGILNLSVGLLAALAVAFFANVLLNAVRVRADLSEHRTNLLSEVSHEAIASLDGLEVRLYVSPDLPETIELNQQKVRLQGLPAKLRDTLEEYLTYGQNARLLLVTQELLTEAERAGLTLFAGQEATLKGEQIELKRYVLGVSFHWRSATETFPLALEPQHYEFEITRHLLRLKEKADQSLVMRDQLALGEALASRGQSCLEALSVPEQAPALAPVLGEQSAQLEALKQKREAIHATCSGLESPLEQLSQLPHRHPQLERMRFIAVALDEESEAFVNTLGLPDGALQALTELSSTHERLQVLAKALLDEKRELDDSPGRRTIGFVCSAQAFCPFPEERPLLPPELVQALTQKNPALKGAIGNLDRVSQELNFTLQQLNQALFRGRGYDLVRVDLSKPLPVEVQALLVLGARADLSEIELFQLDQYLLRGGHLAVFLAPFEPRLQLMDSRGHFDSLAQLVPKRSNLESLLAHHGIQADTKLLVDPSTHGELSSYVQFTRQGERMVPFQRGNFPYPALPTFTELDTQHPLVRASTALTFPWPTALQLESKPGLEHLPLIRASAQARLISLESVPVFPPQAMTRALATVPGSDGNQVVAVLTQGTFHSLFASQPGPTLPEAFQRQTDRPPRLEQGEGRMLVIASNLGLEPLSYASVFENFSLSMLTGEDGGLDHIDRFRAYQVNFQNWSLKLSHIQHLLPQNLPFLHNVLDWLTQRDALAELRSKQHLTRPLRMLSPQQQQLLQGLGLILPTLLFLSLGLLRRWMRQQSLKRLRL